MQLNGVWGAATGKRDTATCTVECLFWIELIVVKKRLLRLLCRAGDVGRMATQSRNLTPGNATLEILGQMCPNVVYWQNSSYTITDPCVLRFTSYVESQRMWPGAAHA